jgi:A/G-specific adenine glycosylase
MAWFEAEGRDLPWRRPGFTPWGALVSEFMLQQTPVSRVIPKLKTWLERWPTPAALATDSPGEAVRAWDKLGYPRRALWLHACAVAIVERFNGAVPSRVDDLLSLPGVGPYTARAVAVFAFGAHEPVVDTNIRRVIARHQKGLADQGAPREKLDLADMDALLPHSDRSPVFNQAVMELGALICTSKSPSCERCPISETCSWRLSGYPANADGKKPKQKKYEGSDRQVRGAILALLRTEQGSVTKKAIDQAWPDAVTRDRALASLLMDGLVVAIADDTFSLPS